MLIPLLGEAVIHDRNDGRIMDATQFISVMTSNLDTGREPANPVGFFSAAGAPDAARQVREAISGYFPKDVLGRIDDVVVFASLSDVALRQLWEREVTSLAARLSAAGTRIQLQIDGAVTDRLLQDARASIKAEGARAVRKLFDRAIADRCPELLAESAGPGRVIVQPADGDKVRYRLVDDPTVRGH